MKNNQDNTGALSALLRTADGVDTPVTNSLCCAAAGIIAPSSSNAEALIPHEKLRRAALVDATLTASERPAAQPALGYTHTSNAADYPPESKPGRLYWPADLTNIRPEEWAAISPKHVAEFAGMTEVWLLLEAAQKRIAELEQVNANLLENATALNIDCDVNNEVALEMLLELDTLRAKLKAEDNSHSNTIDQRDRAETFADQLAQAICDHFRVDIGEHSNLNCPWSTALEIIGGDFETDSNQDRELKRLHSLLAEQDALFTSLRTYISEPMGRVYSERMKALASIDGHPTIATPGMQGTI
ncbi:hypothetical protein [Pseudomonas fluorescens]|uniref:hypothetical protein n=1 Tax=Pseudomonas fluorescens TaxID=294 RepID=UPI00203509C8|nr:hypothetical protein [Pseudomonas fluorescens]